jgi:hypothetical protein
MNDIDDPTEYQAGMILSPFGRFVSWLVLASCYPIAINVLGNVYCAPSSPPPTGYDPGWPDAAVSWFCFAAAVHAICGIVLLRGYRIAVVLLSFPFLFITVICSFTAGWAITGYYW